jgi:hypothetical protein
MARRRGRWARSGGPAMPLGAWRCGTAPTSNSSIATPSSSSGRTTASTHAGTTAAAAPPAAAGTRHTCLRAQPATAHLLRLPSCPQASCSPTTTASSRRSARRASGASTSRCLGQGICTPRRPDLPLPHTPPAPPHTPAALTAPPCSLPPPQRTPPPQLREFYGPLLASVTATKSAYDAMVRQHSADGSARGFQAAVRADPHGQEAKAYRWAGVLGCGGRGRLGRGAPGVPLLRWAGGAAAAAAAAAAAERCAGSRSAGQGQPASQPASQPARSSQPDRHIHPLPLPPPPLPPGSG